MPFLKTTIAILAIPVVAAGYVVVMGTTGACSTCASIMSSITGGAVAPATPASIAPEESTAPPAADPLIEATGMFAIPLLDLDGRPATLAEHAGRPMLIEVWATWCGPCRKVRSIIKQHETELSQVATLVGVSVDEGGPAVVKSYLAKGDGPRMLEFMVTPQFRAAIAPLDTKPTIPKLLYVAADGRIANLSYGVNSPTFMLGLLRNLRSTGAG